MMRWLRLLAGAALVAALFWRFGTGAFLDGLRSLGPGPIAAALGLGAVTTVASAARWRLVAARLGLRLPFGEAVGDYYGAQFLNGVLPAGVLGDVNRAVQHGRRTGDVGRGVRAVVLERAAGQAVVVVAGLAVLAFRPQLLPRQMLICLAIVAVVLVAFGWWARRRGWAVDVRTGLLAVWPGVTGWSVVAVAGHLTLFVIAARAAGATAPLTVLLPLLVLALLAMGLPLNVAGFGPREGAAAVSFAAAGLGAQLGVTVAVGYGVLGLVSTLPGGVVLVVRRIIPRVRPVGSAPWWRRLFARHGDDGPRPSCSCRSCSRRHARPRTRRSSGPVTSWRPRPVPSGVPAPLITGSSRAFRTRLRRSASGAGSRPPRYRRGRGSATPPGQDPVVPSPEP